MYKPTAVKKDETNHEKTINGDVFVTVIIDEEIRNIFSNLEVNTINGRRRVAGYSAAVGTSLNGNEFIIKKVDVNNEDNEENGNDVNNGSFGLIIATRASGTTIQEEVFWEKRMI